jgi:glyoxylase-like metal-dependent hydrolase (beta-lactamase superfamily II)
MITINNYKILPHIQSHFRLDGGAMFGSIPKNLWQKKIAPDAENCIPLVARSLYIEYLDRKILVDVGLGDIWSEKEKQIFSINNTNINDLPYKNAEITDLILTHLHFDHAGGLAIKNQSDEILPCYPNAIHHLQSANYANAKNPNVKEQASYRPSILKALEMTKINLLNGDTELFPGLFLFEINGHTRGQQWLGIESKELTVAFPSDLMPTAHHLNLPYCMGYDINAELLLKEKQDFINYVKSRNAEIIFQHDQETVSYKF